MAGVFYPLPEMMTERQLGWRKLFLILTVLPCCRGLQVSIPQAEYEVARGDNITLTCSFVPANPVLNIFLLTWEAYPDNPDDSLKPVATYFMNNPIDIAPLYEGRAFLEIDTDKRVSTLRLTKVTSQDNRRYQCSVKIPNDDEGTTAATTSLLVLVSPSPPICRIQGRAEYFHNITLTCLSEEGSPAPSYDWKSYSVENIPRTFPLTTTHKDGAVSLFNISRETSGFYICTSTNRIGSAKCNFTLAVVPSSMNISSTAGIIGGVLAGLVALGILIFCCRRKKSKKNKHAEGSPGEMQFYDKDAPEAGEQYHDDKSNSEKKQVNQFEDKDVITQNSYSAGAAGQRFEEDWNSSDIGKERHDDKGSDISSQGYKDNQRDRYRGSRDRLDDRYGGSRDHLDNQRDRYGDSRDRYGGSRDRLEDQRDRYGGSRDRLEDQRDRYGGSRDRLEDQRDRYGGSRDRLEDQRDRYGGSRDRLEDQRDRYDGNRDVYNDRHNHYGGRHDNGRGNRYGGSHDREDYDDGQHRSRYE